MSSCTTFQKHHILSIGKPYKSDFNINLKPIYTNELLHFCIHYYSLLIFLFLTHNILLFHLSYSTDVGKGNFVCNDIAAYLLPNVY